MTRRSMAGVALAALVVLSACSDSETEVSAPSIVPVHTVPGPGPDTVPGPGPGTHAGREDDRVERVPGTSSTTTVAPTTTTTRPVAPVPAIESLSALELSSTIVATVSFPTGAAEAPDGSLYVIGQLGEVWRLVDGVVEDELVLDLTERTSVIEAASSERGVLGIAFNPVDDRLFVHFTDTDGHNVVASWEVVDGTALIETERVVLTHDQPGPGHNGGGLVFTPDGQLFVGIGDGGASNGDDARDLSNLLGSVARIVPRVDGPGYDIPADNPFVDDADIASEIYAYGFRNPWRLFLDVPTGDLWVGDVGNNTTEELDVVRAGSTVRDYGWNLFEGTRRIRSRDVGETVLPVHEWDRDVGFASIGGVVYRNDRWPQLDGTVVFGDLSGVVMLLGDDGGEAAVSVHRPGVSGLVSLHTTSDGELYGLVIWGEIIRFEVVG